MGMRGPAWTSIAFAAGLAVATWCASARARVGTAGEAAYWRERAEAAGRACSPVYGLWWVERECPGLAGLLLPSAVRALVCPARIKVYRASALERVVDRAARLPPGGGAPLPVVLEERGASERELDLLWKAEIRR